MNNFKQIFDQAVRASEDRQWIIGRLGRINASGTITFEVDGRPNFVYVRLGVDGERGTTIARNTGVPFRAHIPVRMREEHGVLVIHSLDHSSGRLDRFLGTGGLAGVVYHAHRTGSGLEFVMQRELLEPYWSGTGINTTPQTILTDGVENAVTIQYTLSTDVASSGGVTTVLNNGYSNIVFGADIFQFAVSAAGVLTIARTSGSNDAAVQLWLTWL